MNQETAVPTPTAGVVAFTKDLRCVLLLKHTQLAAHKTGMYGIPAGHIDEGEESIETAARELEEETGIRILNKNTLIPVGVIYTAIIETKYGLKTFTMETFTFVLEEGMSPMITEEGEPELVSLSELSSLELLPNVQLAITDALLKLQSN
jgi:8-oxo-dGTP pyrophosphatase MutT (NUDIX family)